MLRLGDIWVEKCLEIWRTRERFISNFLVGLDFELEGSSMNRQVVRSRCRLLTLRSLILIRSVWRTRFRFLEASIYYNRSMIILGCTLKWQ